MGAKINLVGEKFGKLTVIKESPTHIHPSGKSGVKWDCICDCGNEVSVFSQSLRKGTTISCGCSKVKHMKTKTDEYIVWAGMKQRCYDKKSISYPNYGGRGIKVCERWLNSFTNFLEDMEERPDSDYSIERLDVNGDYCPENCIWIENEKQARNHRKQKNNTSGVTGVYVERNRIRAGWVDREGVQRSKSFSIKKYGEGAAFKLACEYRDKMIQELNFGGANYGEKHGK